MNIPSNVTTIIAGSFKECTSLKEVILSKGLEMIEREVFQGHTSLLRINIPSTVTSICSLVWTVGEAVEKCPVMTVLY
jgi:hypothetical protein